MTYPPPQQPAYPQPPAKRGVNKILIAAIVGGALLLVCCGGCGVLTLVSASNPATPSSPAPPAAQPGKPASKAPDQPAPAAAAKIGTPVRDGKFEFVVKSAKCGATNFGGQFGKTAQGHFCVVDVTVKNIGDQPQTFHSSSQKSFNAAGQELAVDDTATIYANENSAAFLNEINPGNTTSAKLVWDVPKTAKLVRLKLHDSPFSGGVEVTLS